MVFSAHSRPPPWARNTRPTRPRPSSFSNRCRSPNRRGNPGRHITSPPVWCQSFQDRGRADRHLGRVGKLGGGGAGSESPVREAGRRLRRRGGLGAPTGGGIRTGGVQFPALAAVAGRRRRSPRRGHRRLRGAASTAAARPAPAPRRGRDRGRRRPAGAAAAGVAAAPPGRRGTADPGAPAPPRRAAGCAVRRSSRHDRRRRGHHGRGDAPPDPRVRPPFCSRPGRPAQTTRRASGLPGHGHAGHAGGISRRRRRPARRLRRRPGRHRAIDARAQRFGQPVPPAGVDPEHVGPRRQQAPAPPPPGTGARPAAAPAWCAGTRRSRSPEPGTHLCPCRRTAAMPRRRPAAGLALGRPGDRAVPVGARLGQRRRAAA